MKAAINSLQRCSNTRRGFTLVELVVVVLILGILAAVAVPTVFNNREQAAVVSTMHDVQAIKDSVEMFQAQNGSLPGIAFDSFNTSAFDPYIDSRVFTKRPPVTDYTTAGWIWHPSFPGYGPVIYVYDGDPDYDLWQKIDDQYDNGDLETGGILLHSGQQILFFLAE